MSVPTYVAGQLFTKAHRLVRVKIYDVLGEYELNPTSWSILGATLQADGGTRLASVATSLSVKPPLVTMLADELISRGLIKRIPHHTDRRAKLLVITQKGKKLSQEIETRLNQEIGTLLSGLSVADITAFQRVLETIIQNAE
jgi:DNA-binding MarR family transcriptional regulator